MKTTPLKHQASELEKFGSDPRRALWWDPGTGKSWETLATLERWFNGGEISRALVIAPNGVHLNWTRSQIPLHYSQDLQVYTWLSGKKGSKKFVTGLKDALSWKGPALAALSYDAISTDLGINFAKKFMGDTGALILDESHFIKTPGAARTRRALALAKQATHIRLLTGTPITNAPFDMYTQLRAIDPKVWFALGCRNSEAFRTYFGVFVRQHMGARQFNQLVEYRNLDVLREFTLRLGTRVRKEDVLDLPEKIYTTAYFELERTQWKVYVDLVTDLGWYGDDGEFVDGQLAIVRMLRLQQICSGYIVADLDAKKESVELCAVNPRLSCLLRVIESRPEDESIIIWTKFRYDVKTISELLMDNDITFVTYNGDTSDDARTAAVRDFQDRKVRVFLANSQAAHTGLTLTAATCAIYYNNSFNWGHRAQSEDRCHRIGTEGHVDYIDIVAARTIDEKITEALLEHRDLAATVLGELKEMVQ